MEKIIQVPEETLDKVEYLFDYIERNAEAIINHIEKEDHYIFSRPIGKLPVTPLKGDPFYVTVVLLFEEGSSMGGAYSYENKMLLINLDSIESKEKFVEVVHHELVHAMDPKSYDQKMINRYPISTSRGPNSKSFIYKYLKAPEEFDAFSSQILRVLKKNLERHPEIPPKRLLTFLSNILSKDPAEVYSSKYEDLLPLFNSKPTTNLMLNRKEFLIAMELFRNWRRKPTLYKQFLKRAYLELV